MLPVSLFRRAAPTTPAVGQVLASISSLSAQPSPIAWRVGIRISPFEACSGFTHIAARRIAQPPTRPLSRGFNPGDRSPKLLVSYRTYRQLSVWNLPPLEKRAFKAHKQSRASRCGWIASPSARNDGRAEVERHRTIACASNAANSRNMYRIEYPNSAIAALRRSDSSPLRSEKSAKTRQSRTALHAAAAAP